jgi:hypothetical protein
MEIPSIKCQFLNVGFKIINKGGKKIRSLEIKMRSHTETRTSQTIRLRLVNARRVTFTPDTVDNEHSKKKKSKICCIKRTNCTNRDLNKYERDR